MAGKHAVLSASGSHRWLHCPGSIRLCDGIADESSTYARQGTAAHELAERCLTSLRPAKHFIDNVFHVEGEAFTVDKGMAEAVQLYLDTVYDAIKEAGKGAVTAIEQRFDLSHLYPGMFGRNDFLVGQPFGKLTILDYKHGAGVAVEAKDNSQLLYYALGALSSLEDLYEEVEMVIVQPRAFHPDGPVRRWRISEAEVHAWGRDVLIPGALATEEPNAPLHVGDHCRFCPALALCPEQQRVAVSVAQSVFAEVVEPPKSPDLLSPADLRRILDKKKVIENWLSACAERVRNDLERGAIKPEDVGYKIVEGRASRSWHDEAEAAEFLRALDVEPTVTAMKSPAQVEKELRGKAKTALEPFVKITRGRQLAPLSDKRAALPSAPESVFEAAIEE